MPGSSPGMTSVFVSPCSKHSFSISPRVPREFCLKFLSPENSEGAGNAGRPTRPQPRVQMKKAHEHSHHGHTGFTRHSPRNGFNGFLRALPGDEFVLSPSPAKVAFRKLDAGVEA